HTERAYPLMTRLAGPPSDHQPMPLRRWDPTCRLRGWRTLATEVDRVRAELHGEGIEPVLAASSWALPGEIGFYCAGQPLVYSVGLAMGDRHSQYDLWRPNPVADRERFQGRTFIVVGWLSAEARQAFDKVEPAQIIWHTEQGEPINSWAVFV